MDNITIIVEDYPQEITVQVEDYPQDITVEVTSDGITVNQANQIIANTQKVGYTDALVSANTDVVNNTAKIGITAQQVSDIATNNSKVEITVQQASDIVTNNDKIGITTEQSSNIISNNSKVGITPTQTTAISDNSSSINTINSTAEFLSNKGQASGYVPLGANGKILELYLPSSVIGQSSYIGTWDANTNNPTLSDPTTVNGDYYITNVAGTYLSVSYEIGDWVISNGIAWEKIDNTDDVKTVFGRIGNILANEADYNSFYPTLTNLPNLVSNNSAA